MKVKHFLFVLILNIVGCNSLPFNVLSTNHESSFSKDFSHAASLLFDHSLADPRGCEYRRIGIITGNPWNPKYQIETNGWVLPEMSDCNQRYAICWNGLIYPIIFIGEKCSLNNDIKLIKLDQEIRNYNVYGYSVPEYLSASHKTLIPMKACLLYRLGEENLTRTIYNALIKTADLKSYSIIFKNFPYIELRWEFMWSLYDRSLWAFCRGDDNLSYISLKTLWSLLKEIKSDQKPLVNGSKLYDYDFFNPAYDLLKDLERRINTSKEHQIHQIDKEIFSNKKDYIAFLIEKLEQISLSQTSQPGNVQFRFSKEIEALVNEGEFAIEPLLSCLENDMRLIRSVRFWKDFAHSREIIRVCEAAYVALLEIIKIKYKGQYFNHNDYDDLKNGIVGQKKVTERIRNYIKGNT